MACLVRAIRVADSTKYMFFTDEQCWEYVGIRLRFMSVASSCASGRASFRVLRVASMHACMEHAIAPRMHAVMQPGATGLKPYPQSQILASDMKCMLSGMAGRFYYTCKARSKPLPLLAKPCLR